MGSSNLDVPLIEAEIREHERIVEQVTAELEEVEGKLQALKERLETHSKSIQDRKALLAPIQRLPIDILSSVFLSCHPAERKIKPRGNRYGERPPRSNMGKDCPSVILSHVCHHWRQVAINTPLLWTKIELRPPQYPVALNPSHYNIPAALAQDAVEHHQKQVMTWEADIQNLADALEVWLSRSSGCPLSLEFSTSRDVEGQSSQKFVDILCDVSARWKDVKFQLFMSGPKSPLHRLTSFRPEDVPLLQKLNLTIVFPDIDFTLGEPLDKIGWKHTVIPRTGLLRAHSLQSLSLSMLPQPIMTIPVDWSALTELTFNGHGPQYNEANPMYEPGGPEFGCKEALVVLKACKRLVRCVLHFEAHRFDGSAPLAITITERIAVPFLEELYLSGTGVAHGFASSLILPSLHTLSILGYAYHPLGENESGLLDFIDCHGTALTSLSFNYSSLTQPALLHCLERLPNVVELRMESQSTDSYATRNDVSPRPALFTTDVLSRLTPPKSDDASRFESVLCPKLDRFGCHLKALGFTEEDLIQFVAARRRVDPENHARIRTVYVSFASSKRVDLDKALKGRDVDTEDFVLKTSHEELGDFLPSPHQGYIFPPPLENMHEMGFWDGLQTFFM